MLNTWTFTLLAGNPEAWDRELTEANIETYPGLSKIEVSPERRSLVEKQLGRRSLLDLQIDQHERGRRSAQLVHTVGGWSVRYVSSLDNFGPIPGEMFVFRSRELAVKAGKRWANADPDNREFFARNDLLDPNKYAEDGTPINTGEEL